MSKEPILKLENVHVKYDTDDGAVHAVRGVTYDVYEDETLAIVGESGCGKSQSSYAAMGLIQPPGRVSDGKIWFRNKDGGEAVNLLDHHKDSKKMRSIRGGPLAMIFQEPMTALSPVHRIGQHLDEVLKLHTDLNKKQRFDRSCELLTQVGIPDAAKRYTQYSFEFSGGMRQRIMIAIALACNPRLLIADEPTTGLDVTIQNQILELMASLQEKHHMGVVLITHDLAVVAENADRVAVMYLGRIVETTDVHTLFEDPKHPYTVSLLKSVVGSPLTGEGRLQAIRGTVPGPLDVVPGCPFHPRCDEYMPGICDQELPTLEAVNEKTCAACFLYQNRKKKEASS
ncbi:ABC transporter ATP-binding protein [Kiritimatiellaeota bacterium B1221]|nr:ABC transporter ATP-binding protein [Kiritimatiellaeota bacterium B1221]